MRRLGWGTPTDPFEDHPMRPYPAGDRREMQKFVADLGEIVSARELLKPMCESPIETVLGSFLLTQMRRYLYVDRYFCVLCSRPCMRCCADNAIQLVPQYPWRRYRVDFAVFAPGIAPTFIECDGAEFHRATEEQIDRDLRRDGEMQAAGFRVHRFSGADINRRPADCAATALFPIISAIYDGIEGRP